MVVIRDARKFLKCSQKIENHVSQKTEESKTLENRKSDDRKLLKSLSSLDRIDR